MKLKNKTILVTGGTGSLGKVLVGRLLSLPKSNLPKKIIVMSRDEGKQHDMRLSYLDKKASTDEVIYKNFQQALEFRIGDVRSFADVTSSMKGADIVINAAAMKQVPTSEYFPEQAILTNCNGNDKSFTGKSPSFCKCFESKNKIYLCSLWKCFGIQRICNSFISSPNFSGRSFDRNSLQHDKIFTYT